MVEDWSRAISSASLGKKVERRGEFGVGLWRVGVVAVILIEGLRGWVRVIVKAGVVAVSV